MNKFPHVDFSPRWRIMTYDIYGVKMFAVEKGSYTEAYFDNKKGAELRLELLEEYDNERKRHNSGKKVITSKG